MEAMVGDLNISERKNISTLDYLSHSRTHILQGTQIGLNKFLALCKVFNAQLVAQLDYRDVSATYFFVKRSLSTSGKGRSIDPFMIIGAFSLLMLGLLEQQQKLPEMI